MNRLRWQIFIAALAAAVIAEFVLPIEHHGEEQFWYQIPAYWALFGFVGCVLIVVVSKWLGSTMLNRDEEYYDE